MLKNLFRIYSWITKANIFIFAEKKNTTQKNMKKILVLSLITFKTFCQLPVGKTIVSSIKVSPIPKIGNSKQVTQGIIQVSNGSQHIEIERLIKLKAKDKNVEVSRIIKRVQVRLSAPDGTESSYDSNNPFASEGPAMVLSNKYTSLVEKAIISTYDSDNKKVVGSSNTNPNFESVWSEPIRINKEEVFDKMFIAKSDIKLSDKWTDTLTTDKYKSINNYHCDSIKAGKAYISIAIKKEYTSSPNSEKESKLKINYLPDTIDGGLMVDIASKLIEKMDLIKKTTRVVQAIGQEVKNETESKIEVRNELLN